MTRTKKNRKLYKRNMFILIIILLIKGIITIVRLSVKLIILLIKIIYKLIKIINNLITKLFIKLPRILKVITIYSLIILSILEIQNLTNYQNKLDIKQKRQIVKQVQPIEATSINTIKKEEQQQQQPIKQTQIHLENINANNIYNKGIELGLTKEQSLLIVSISQHETGNWTSRVFRNNYNFGGVMCNAGLRKYNSYEEGLTHFVMLLKRNYFDKGLTTIESIGAKYCPVGAENDPHGLNKNWIPSVTNIYNSYLKSVK